jgi:predicted small secreted protein
MCEVEAAMPDEKEPKKWWEDIIGILPLAAGVIAVVLYVSSIQSDSRILAAAMQSDTKAVLVKLGDLQGSLVSIRTQTDTLPRLSADVLNLERRITSLENGHNTQDDRLSKTGDAMGLMRNDISDLRGELRSVTNASRMPLTPTGRPGR